MIQLHNCSTLFRHCSCVILKGNNVRRNLMAETRITINTNGSIRVEGEFALYDKRGKSFQFVWENQDRIVSLLPL